MNIKAPPKELQSPVGAACDAIAGTLTVTIRAAALVVFLALSLAEPVVAFMLCGMALGCFWVSVLFGFIFHAYFPHRWFVLGASIVFLALYLLYRFLMLGVGRLMR
jgi:hypothetical protein